MGAFAEALHGRPYARPASAVAEYVGAVRSLLHGGPPGPAGPLFPLGAALPPAAAPTPEIAAGVLRPGVAQAAGRTADTAVSWMTPPEYVRDVLLPALEEGARAAGRPDPGWSPSCTPRSPAGAAAP
ncbi:LLM class flavin-dependent oxidoreductase [Streptomyces jumonjinensis]|uniref:LLM class flavin-dependent oxidoreductase n=1 Tax=Streptomyces jumonjinensis TaxID=1945 RepID=UPI00379FA9D8